MSTHRGPFPNENNAFNTYFNAAFAYLSLPANVTRLLISAPNLAELTAQHAIWIVLFPLSMNDSSATKQNRGERDELREDIETTLKDIYDDIPKSVMTATDRSKLNLHLRASTHTARGPITDIPIADARAIGGGAVKFTLRLTSDVTRASRHPLADVIEMKYVLLSLPAPGATIVTPATADDCERNHFSKKAIFTVHYGASAPGKMLYCFFRWVNLSNPANNSPWTGVRIVHLS